MLRSEERPSQRSDRLFQQPAGGAMNVLNRDLEVEARPYYSISEVIDLVGVKPHVLRYWETQFKMLRPKKGRGGARMYRKRDVEVLFEIKQLLYDQRFTIAGARRRILDGRDEKEQIELPF